MRTEYRRSVSAINLAVFFWGVTPVFVKASDATSSAILAFRLIISAPIALLFFYREGSRFTRGLVLKAAIPAFFFYVSTVLIIHFTVPMSSNFYYSIVQKVKPGGDPCFVVYM